jgi:hypothetical protein
MLFTDYLGLFGVLVVLAAYAGVQLGRLDSRKAGTLLMNFGGASLVMISLIWKFNVSAFLVEAAWALIAAFGLVRLALSRRRSD